MKQFVALFLALTLPAMGADTAWDRLQEVPTGEKIWIHYTDGGKLRKAQGTMGAWSEDGLTVQLRKGDVVVSRNDVRQVFVDGGKSGGKGARNGFLIGAAVGGGVFALAGSAGDSGSADAGIVVALLAIGALVGGVIGVVVGSLGGGAKKVLVYAATAAGPVSVTAPQAAGGPESR